MPTAPILVCGEALVDVFPAGDTPQGLALDARIGGSPFNVAIGLARLAQSVALLGAVSRDAMGRRLMRALMAEGVDVGCVERTHAPTTVVMVGEDADGEPTYAFHGEHGADRQLSLLALERTPPGLRAVHVGSYALLVDPIGGVLRQLVERVRGDTLVSWDPNVRLAVVPREAAWRDLAAWMVPRVHLLKVSEQDLGTLAPGATRADFGRVAIDSGVSLVIVTRGGEGAMAMARGIEVEVGAASSRLVDTVGAGDTFQAAVLAWLAETGRLSPTGLASLDTQAVGELLTFASRAAAITCSRRGADLPRRAEL